LYFYLNFQLDPMTTTVVVITPATPPGPTSFLLFILLFPRDRDDVKGEPPQFRLCDMKEDDGRDTKMKKVVNEILMDLKWVLF
jgi:hypothetical protein